MSSAYTTELFRTRLLGGWAGRGAELSFYFLMVCTLVRRVPVLVLGWCGARSH